MTLAVPCIPAELPRPIPGKNDRFRPPPPADEKTPPAKRHLAHFHHSATTAAQRITAIKNSTRNIGSRPFFLNVTPKQMPREPGIEPGFRWRNPRTALLYRPGKTIAPTAGVKTAQAPEHLPTGWKARTAAGSPPSAKGHWWSRLDSNQGIQAFALSLRQIGHGSM